MNDTERVLGSLQEFKENTKAQHAEFKKELHVINTKIDGLYSLKWKIAGGVGVVSFIISLLVSISTTQKP